MILYNLCSSVLETSHHPQWASCSRSQEGEDGAALPWQCHHIWHTFQAEVAEGAGPQAGGRGGRGRNHARQGVVGTAVPHGSLHVCQQQHQGTQLHLRVRERWVQTWRRLYRCPQPRASLSLAPPLDPQNVFQRTIVNVILERAGENCIIPCLVTDPEVSRLALETCDGRPLPSGMKYHSNLQRGVIINNVRKNYEGCYVCVGQLGGVKVVSSQYTVDVLLGKQELQKSAN